MVGFMCKSCCRRFRRANVSESFLTAESPPTTFTSAVSEIEAGTVPNRGGNVGEILSRVGLQNAIANYAKTAKSQCNDTASSSTGRGASWRENSIPRQATRWWLRVVRDQPQALTSVVVQMDTASVVPEFPLLHFTSEGVASGALLLIMDVESWPRWVWLCQSVNVLRRWGPGEVLAQMNFKVPIVGMQFETTIYLCLLNRLHDKGRLDLVACSIGSTLARSLISSNHPGVNEAPTTSERPARSLFDVSLPSKKEKKHRLNLSAEVEAAQLRFYPTGHNGLQSKISIVLVIEEHIPVDKIVRKIWEKILSQLLPTLARHTILCPRFVLAASDLPFYSQLEQRLAECKSHTEGG